MKSFADYLKIKESDDSLDNPASVSDTEETTALERMVRIAWKKHNSEVRSFFEKLSMIDPELAAEYERVGSRKKKSSDKSDNPFGEKDVVRVNPADSGYGGDPAEGY